MTPAPHIFSCADCGIEEHRPGPALPLGWDLAPGDVLRCPDCNERIEREFAASRATPLLTVAARR